MEKNESVLNNGDYACMTCDRFDKCELHIKNQSESVYCTEQRLKYGCAWVYRRSMWDGGLDDK